MSRLFLGFILFWFVTGCEQTPQKIVTSDFENWVERHEQSSTINEFQAFLLDNNVSDVFPLEQLLRSDVRWYRCGSEPFMVPPPDEWPNIVETLKVTRDVVVPLVGAVEGLSVYRDPKINNCIGGASRSYHMQFFAIDMRPIGKMDRETLILKLCKFHKKSGKRLNVGLGIYRATRFHIDTAGYRTWGQDKKASSSPCLSDVAVQHQTG
ncbi:MAG: D-Ala-D-Ala carboxypeptidase family metallohydrolase [Parasphingorhabdus sp.]